MTLAADWVPCMSAYWTTKWTDGHRLRAFSSTSRSASEALPVTSPTPRGRKGSGRLSRASKRPSAASARRRASSWASSSPSPCGRISRISRERLPLASQNDGFARTTTRAPSMIGAARRSRTLTWHLAWIEILASRSRSVRKQMPGRRLSSVISASSHTAPIRPTHWPISIEIWRSGAGDSGLVSRGMG